ncbi:glycosyltransferase family 1 protein [Deinococcus psychrotolerans]|uniref:Glycosyltransferase family 1 protein n=1 Tax=Deinococcus psychrotolerans TaxID=2489213 RepID=A0A3G8YI51_9DEIO|nr:glycosyltransferase [Deinococcus psychrotolerans]AZI43897.1 glycosyltransferase family 1 protein [Deinococcus psychrotolerans]
MARQGDLICLAHLRWDFVFQRPQHLMGQAARDRRVYYVEPPLFGEWDSSLEIRSTEYGVTVVVPRLLEGLDAAASQARTAAMLNELALSEAWHEYTLWVYTPMEMPLVTALDPSLVIYDCMDELANFRFAPPELRPREQQLLARADLVFTGGHRLWEAKREQHPHAYPFPSSVDKAHFARARRELPDPADQADLNRPRLGFYGVIDERFDTALLAELAERRPEWQFVLLGPVVKIQEGDLPRAANLHYLGMKSYAELPQYLAHWDVALLLFARNASTEFISPTKTPEYLAAGVPVVSTEIRDVVRPYGEQDLVRIANRADDFEAACEAALAERHQPEGHDRQARADAYLAGLSWSQTWAEMETRMNEARGRKATKTEAADD